MSIEDSMAGVGGPGLLIGWLLTALPLACCIKVAVYEHDVYSQENPKFPLEASEARAITRKNLDVFATQARNAVAQVSLMLETDLTFYLSIVLLNMRSREIGCQLHYISYFIHRVLQSRV